MLFWVVVFSDEQGRFENTGLDRLDFYGRRKVRGEITVNFFESKL